uniref:Cyclic nucleotide-binding domain-containing protein n=1 Tax=Guillardia theta TaxID=55529 RepID=A0A6U5XVS2_GUITH
MDEMVENRKKIEKVLQQRLSELLKILTDREIRNLSNKGKIHRFDKDQVISAHGELGDSLKCVVSGSLEASSIYGQGANEISQRELTLGRGNTFGEEAILDMPCVMTVKALGPCEVCYIHVQHFRSVIGKNADVNAVLRSSLTWQEKHKSPLQILAQRKCKLLEIMSDDAIKTLSKEVEKMYIESDTLLCSQGDDGDSMFIIIKGCARATCTRSIAFQDPTTKENLTKTIELETQVYKEGDAFEDACVALGQQRIATVLALSGSCVGVLKRESMSRALISNELINSMKQFYEGSSSETFIAEALMLRSPSALFPMLDHRELRMLALGSQIQVYPENAILIQQGKTNHNIFLMLEGSAAIHVSSPSEGYQEVARVRDGQSVRPAPCLLGLMTCCSWARSASSWALEQPRRSRAPNKVSWLRSPTNESKASSLLGQT